MIALCQGKKQIIPHYIYVGINTVALTTVEIYDKLGLASYLPKRSMYISV